MIQKAGGDIRVLEERAMAEAAAGRLRPAVQRFPLAEAAAAHRALETRGTVGKVVLVLSGRSPLAVTPPSCVSASSVSRYTVHSSCGFAPSDL